MELKLNRSVLWKLNREPYSDELFKYATGVIADLRKLYSINELSDDELKEIFGKCYSFLPNEDIRSYKKLADCICTKTFKSNQFNFDILKTNIIVGTPEEPDKLAFVDAWVYSSIEAVLDKEHIYSYEEIEELINAKKIIIDGLYASNEREVLDSDILKGKEYSFYSLFPSIKNISGEYMAGHEAVILPFIRKRLQHSKVQRDIMRIINIMRKRTHEYLKELSRKKAALTFKKENTERLIALNDRQREDFTRKLSLLSEKID